MGRPSKIWFRKDIGWWMVTLGGVKTRLVEGKANKQAAQDKFHELTLLQSRMPEAPSARVADVIEAFLAWSKIHRSDETNRNYVWYGEKFAEAAGYLHVCELKPIHVTRFVDKHGWTQTTERNARRSVYRAFSWAKEEGVISENPLRGMKCPKARTRERALTSGAFVILMRKSRRDFKRLLFALKQTGCRPKEARTLTWDQVQGDRWVLAKHKTAYKVGKPRVIFLSKPMQRLMVTLKSRSTSEYVFLNGRGEPWTVNAIRCRINRLKEKTDLPKDVCSYLLRHAFGTNAILNGVDVVTVAQLMGHESLDMIKKVYAHLADKHEHLQDALEQVRRRPAPSKPPQGEKRRGA
jgi:integrase